MSKLGPKLTPNLSSADFAFLPVWRLTRALHALLGARSGLRKNAARGLVLITRSLADTFPHITTRRLVLSA